MSSTPHVSRSRKLRGVAVAVVALALIAAAFSGEGAQATSTTVTVFGANRDTGVVDTDRDGAAEWNSYGPTNNGLNVGETSQDGWDLRYVVPFALTDSIRAGVANGATAKVRFRIWQVSNLGTRQLKVEALEGDLQGRADYARSGIAAASLTPIASLGGTAAEIDVTSLLRNVASPIVTFRFSLDAAGAVDGQKSYVNIATAESGRAENRPQLLVTIPEVAKPTAPTTAAPATVAPTTAPPKTAPPTTVAPTTAPTTAAPTTTTPTTKPSTTPSGWNLTFADEFNGSSLDTSKWNYDASTFGDGNREIECNDRATSTLRTASCGSSPKRASMCARTRRGRASSPTAVHGARRRSTPEGSSRKPKVDSRFAPGCRKERASGPPSG